MPRNITVTFSDGSSHVYNNAPDDVTPDAVHARAEKEFSKSVKGIDGGNGPKPSGEPVESGLFRATPKLRQGPQQLEDIKRLLNESSTSAVPPQVGTAEVGLSMATGLGSTILGGLSGLGRTGYNLLAGEGFDKSMELGGRTSQAMQHAMTYQPRSSSGKLQNELISVPFNAVKQATSSIGGDIGDAGEKTINYLANDKIIGPGQGRVAGESIGNVAPDIYGVLKGGGNALKNIPPLLEKKPMPGKDFTPLRDLSPVEAERMQRMTDQGIKPTLGQVTRDPAQWRFEEQTGKQTTPTNARDTKATPGQQLRERELDTNDALIKHVADTDKLRAGRAVSENRRETGAAVGNALKTNADASLQKVSALYEKAKQSGETKQIVNTKTIEDFLHEESGSHPSIDIIQRKLDKLKEKNGGELSIDNLEQLYKDANRQINFSDNTSSHFMGELKSRINAATEGAGGDMYRAARRQRLAHALEFEDRAAVSRLIENKTGSKTDVKTASEDVFKKTVVNSSLEELKDVTNSLGASKSKQSLQAIRELQAETINYVLEKATEKGVPNERGVNGLSPTALRDAVKEIGSDKLTHLLGPDAVKRLDSIVKNAQETKQKPGTVSGSDTGLNAADAASLKTAVLEASSKHMLGRIWGGKIIGDFLDARMQKKITQDRVTEALNPRKAAPNEIARQAMEVKAERKNELSARRNGALKNMAPAGYVAQEQGKNKLIEYGR